MRHRRAWRLVAIAALVFAAGTSLEVQARSPAADPTGPPAPLFLPFDARDPHLRGHGWLVPGIEGQALQRDGIAAHLQVPDAEVPALTRSFTVEGWVALGRRVGWLVPRHRRPRAGPLRRSQRLSASVSRQQRGSPGSGYTGGVYDPGERAWIVRKAKGTNAPIALTLRASEASPLENVALVIEGWGTGAATLSVDGRPVPRGDAVRFGHRQRVDGTDLVAFLTLRATSTVELVVSPQ